MKKLIILMFLIVNNLMAFDLGIILGLTSGVVNYIKSKPHPKKVIQRQRIINKRPCSISKINCSIVNTYDCKSLYKNGKISF